MEEIKEYVRIDSIGEDDFLLGLCATSESLCSDILHRTSDEMEKVPDPVKTAVLYGISYLYENREQADFKDLTLMLKCLLFG